MKEILFSHARGALKFSLENMNLKKKNKILVPDYICEIVNKVIRDYGLHVEPYPILDNFEPDWKYLNKKKLKNIKAILMVHYFGFPQKIDLFKIFCKKNNLLLIEDNAHGFSGIFKKKLLGTFGDFGFSSIRKNIDVAYGAIFYSKKKFLKSISNKKKIRLNYMNFFINNLFNKYPYLKIFIKKYFIKKKNFSNYLAFRDTFVYDYLIDTVSLKFLEKKNFNKIKKKKLENYKIWYSFLKKLKIKPVFKIPNGNLMVWCCPFYVENAAEAKKWFDWGHKNGITIFSWPQLDVSYLKKNKKLIERWKKLVCLPLNVPSKYLKKICK